MARALGFAQRPGGGGGGGAVPRLCHHHSRLVWPILSPALTIFSRIAQLLMMYKSLSTFPPGAR
jgi:hypothetical protein